jgi:ribonucleoside-diphosphate reductase alpha chain
MTRKDRPEEIQSKTFKTKVACGTLFITVGYDDSGPIEIFLNGSKNGTCRANLEGLARALTLCFKYHLPLDEVTEQISKIRCGACTNKIAKEGDKDKKQKMNWSCPDAVARTIRRTCEVPE